MNVKKTRIRMLLVLGLMFSFLCMEHCIGDEEEIPVDVEEQVAIAEEENHPVPQVRDPLLLSFVNRNLDVEERIPSNFTTLIVRLKHDEDIQLILSMLRDKTEEDVVRNEAVKLLYRSGYNGLAGILLEILANLEEEERFRAYCVQFFPLLFESGSEDENESIYEKQLKEVTKFLYKAINDRHLSVRREALLSLVQMKDPKGQIFAIRCLNDPKRADMRDIAIRCISEMNLSKHKEGVRKYLDDPDEFVRNAAKAALKKWDDEGEDHE